MKNKLFKLKLGFIGKYDKYWYYSDSKVNYISNNLLYLLNCRSISGGVYGIRIIKKINYEK